ncbi:hypothetical protein [Acidiphilium acidophilum]|uniref:hypothetical protein n=1 Tax=Acidiphilium acidophilum TaxID=76588 RepID=UPI002E8E6165|nr:hypothetical protein [Acidiphilium acidophilum]
MRLKQRLDALESRTGTKADEITIVRRLIVHRDAEGALQVTGWRERDLRTGEVRSGDGPYDA